MQTWGNDHLWEFSAPKLFSENFAGVFNPAGQPVFGSPSDEASHAPFYVIGPGAGGDGAQSEAFNIGPHDHVIAVLPKNQGTFNANWHIQVVTTPEDSEDTDFATSGSGEQGFFGVPLVHAADTDGDGTLEDLTSVEKVHAAREEGNVTIVPTPTVFVCPVRDIEG